MQGCAGLEERGGDEQGDKEQLIGAMGPLPDKGREMMTS